MKIEQKTFKDLGLESLKMGRPDEALEYFLRFLDSHPSDFDGCVLAADTLFAESKLKDASEYYFKALLLDPFHTATLLKYSSSLLKGPNYLKVLENAHQQIMPKRYIEIGVCKGASYCLTNPETKAIGIDPEPQFEHIGTLPKKHIVVSDTSDNYFASDKINSDFENKTFDMAFLDGMHLFEYALRDFINLEKKSHSDSVIFIHDLYPMNAETSTRERNSDFWSGDVWKLVLCMSEYRSDLDVKVLPCPPTGLGVVKNLDCTSTILEDNYDEILKKFVTMSYNEIANNKDKKLKLVSAEEIGQLYA